jgi:hypothetical protein
MGALQQAMLTMKNPAGGGVAPINPSDQTDIWEWWEPSREAYANNAEITTLHGQKNGRDMTGFFAGFNPIMKTGILNGLAVADCPSGFKSWNGPNMSALSAAHIFAVVKFDADPAASNSDNALWEMGNAAGAEASTRVGKDVTGDVHDAAFTNSLVNYGNPSVSMASWCVYEISSITNELKCFVSGTQVGSTITSNTVSPRSNPRIGCTANGSMVGQIAGMYLFSAKLAADPRAGHIAYINDRFALSAI